MAIVYTFIFIIGVCANLVVIIVIGLDPQGFDTNKMDVSSVYVAGPINSPSSLAAPY